METSSLKYTLPGFKKRTSHEKIKLYHKINIRSGLYRFLGQNFLKMLLILVGIVLLIFLADIIFDLKAQQEHFQVFVNKLQPLFVFIIFLATESVLGLIPPDIFIVWGKTRFPENAYLLVTILATISYIGGIVAYHLGLLIRKFPSVSNYVQKKYEKNFKQIERWGGIVIVMAALFPLPFALTSTVAGILKYPFKPYLLYGLTRYIRFFLYAVVIFGAIKAYL